MAEHAFAASENWPLGWEGWDSACRGRPPAKNTKHNESMTRVISLANLVRVAPMVVQGVVHVAQEQAPTAMRKTLGRDPNGGRRHLVAVTTPAVLKRPVGRINRGRREPGRHGCGESPGAANHRVQRITGCGEAPESLEKRQRIRNILAKRTSSWEGGWGAGPPDVSDVFSIPNEKRDRNANRIGATLAGERAANEDRRRGRVREAPPRFVVPRTFAFPVDGGSRNTTENPGRRQKGGRKSQTPSRAAPRWRRPLPRDPARQSKNR